MITREETIACSYIDLDGSGNYIDHESGGRFDAEAYSRLKYGSRKAAMQMGAMLGAKLLDVVPGLVLDETPPEAVVVYKSVPPACHALSRFCLDIINRERVELGLEPGFIVKIDKSSVVNADYAASSPEDRHKMLDAIGLDANGHSFDDKPVILVDDIRITGSAERRTRQALDEFSPKAVIYGYIALFNEISALKDPAVENRINHTSVNSLNDILRVMDQDGFILNIRTLKRILSEKETVARPHFFENISDELLYELYIGSIDGGPDFIDSYRQGFDQLEAYAVERGVIASSSAGDRVLARRA